MKPSLGRIVIMKLTENQRIELDQISPVADADGEESSAMIVRANFSHTESNTVSLMVFGINGNQLFIRYAPEGDEPGTWHWPPRIE